MGQVFYNLNLDQPQQHVNDGDGNTYGQVSFNDKLFNSLDWLKETKHGVELRDRKIENEKIIKITTQTAANAVEEVEMQVPKKSAGYTMNNGNNDNNDNN